MSLTTGYSSEVGVHSSALELPCSGESTLVKVTKIGTLSAFTDRGGNFNPEKGFAYISSEMTSLAPECEKMQSVLKIDLKKESFSHYFSFPHIVDHGEIQKLAEKKLGAVHQFKTQQHFQYKNSDGYLPFFPLLHKESLAIKSATLDYPHTSLPVNNKNAYGIYLLEADKVKLSQLLFHALEAEEDHGVLKSSLVNALFESYPKYTENYKQFLSEALNFYKKIEHIQLDVSEPYSKMASVLRNFANQIKKLTYQYPESYFLKVPVLLAKHPCLLYVTEGYYFLSCVNLSAMNLEHSLELLSDDLSTSIDPVVKARWEFPLKVIAGKDSGFGVNKCVEKIVSTWSKEYAQQLLDEYY